MSAHWDWEEYLNFSQEIYDNFDEEAALRTVISRAYYALYNVACIEFEIDTRKLPKGKGGLHKKVWDEISKQDFDLSQEGDSLKKKRHTADYKEIFSGDIKSAAETALKTARYFINKISK